MLTFLKALKGKLNGKLLGRRVINYIILWVLSLLILAFNTTKTLSDCKAIFIISKEVRVQAEAFYIILYHNSKQIPP